MASFNFFVVIAALLTTGLARTFDRDFQFHFVGVCLGFCLIIISFIFWKLDQRVRFLIKHAEGILAAIETNRMNRNPDGPQVVAALFTEEEQKTAGIKSRRSWRHWALNLSYSDCFGMVYSMFGLLGLFGGLAAALRWNGVLKP